MTEGYHDAWVTTQFLIYHQGGSLSGREWNRTYLNVGHERFADVTMVSALDYTGDGRSLATVDWDDDGRLDLFLRNRTGPRLQFFRNQGSGTGHFVSLLLEGTSSNRDAIGARAIVELGDRSLRQTVRAGEGFLAQSSKRLHFGLGEKKRIEKLTVVWPDGSVDEFADLAGDRRYRIVQGSETPEVVPAQPATGLEDAAPAPLAGDPGPVRRIPLVEKLPMGAIRIPAFDARDRRVRDLAGKPLLLNLWGSTCASCLKEFADFRDEREKLAASGLQVVTLTRDAPDDHPLAIEILERFDLENGAGYADQGFLDALQLLLIAIVGESGGQGTWPLPMSLLLDAEGQLVALYPARLDLDRLLADVAKLDRMKTGDLLDTRLQFGIRLTPHRRNLTRLGRGFERIGQPEVAAFYRELGAR